MTLPQVDVIIATHTPERDLERSVASVLDHTVADLRLTVVCHNTPSINVRERLGRLSSDPRLRLVELNDGIASPAGPFNLGLELATAAFTSVMGSDDELEPGAVDSWLDRANKASSAVVLARVRHSNGLAVPSPPTRPWRSGRLDGVRDRLSYRSAPLGLVSRRAFPALRFERGVRTGEDISYVTHLWFSGQRVSYDRWGPAYLIHSDGAGRVTTQAPEIGRDLEFLAPLLLGETFRSLRDQQRHALLVKLIRSSLIPLVHNRPHVDQWSFSEREELARVTTLLRTELSRTSVGEGVLSRADIAFLNIAIDPSADSVSLLRAAETRKRFISVQALLPAKLRYALQREAPVRFAASSLLARY
ncbi:glycosyltransferase involved in cell wall biosynthesis [Mycolicibacterium mucogenicum 261Sha1.1M5]|nr:glycosyltransferase involved in cell wall biosynthesis [Mycolicibacterium mucogenicum 261Sha1.1M5]